jgi:hypothetical protein
MISSQALGNALQCVIVVEGPDLTHRPVEADGAHCPETGPAENHLKKAHKLSQAFTSLDAVSNVFSLGVQMLIIAQGRPG